VLSLIMIIIIIIIILIIIIVLISYITTVYLVPQKITVSVTKHILFIVVPKTFRTVRYVLSITAFCIRIYSKEQSRAEISSFKLWCSYFADNTCCG
jgi:hypothetical protein